MKPKKLPKVLLETLELAGWKKYQGTNPMYADTWTKGNRTMAIHLSSMANMYHVNPDFGMLEKKDDVKFLHLGKLLDLIKGENNE